jgi:N-acyl-D-amino-acid deacylase
MRRFRPCAALVLLPLVIVAYSAIASEPMGEQTAREPRLDLLIRGGSVVDGSGSQPVSADVGIKGDRIVFIGSSGKRVTAARTIDASGLIVAPGFIDPHTHTSEDLADPVRKSNVNYLMQGVTTVITGNDGSSPLPTGATLAKWERLGIGTNAALLVGHGTVRLQVLLGCRQDCIMRLGALAKRRK